MKSSVQPKCRLHKKRGAMMKPFPFPLPLVLDGSTGVMLSAAGMPEGVCTEQWVLEHPDILRAIQQKYVQAGSQAVYAPTFCANRVKLAWRK